MNDDDHVKKIRTLVLEINEVERKLYPLRQKLQQAIYAAEDDGLSVSSYGCGPGGLTNQPVISRTVNL